MNSALIVSHTSTGVEALLEVLARLSIAEIDTAKTAGETRRLYAYRGFDLCIIHAPLPDESGTDLAIELAKRGITQVLLIVQANRLDEISHQVEDAGVAAIAKPLQMDALWSALKLLSACHHRMQLLYDENAKLYRTIDDMRYLNRAKLLLMEKKKMGEAEAHRHIEKLAMDRRISKRDAAMFVIKSLER
ncbi:ANTAR domain-containing protein [Eubacteriales bacterium OttesenSCG-928-N14]|nr:ANTAR domain-containing protein [Eubacteriales bacterium OttesenSCG-928-N14]